MTEEKTPIETKKTSVQKKVEKKETAVAPANADEAKKVEEVKKASLKKNVEEIKETKDDEKTEDSVTDDKKDVEDKKESVQKKVEKKSARIKKETAHIRLTGLPISTKQSIEICRYIKGRTVEDSIKLMEGVEKQKIAVPMRGEIPHRKGKIMSGRYPVNTAGVFIKALKSLAGNANVNGIDEPVITIASATHSARPLKKGGRAKFKRTFLHIIVRDKEKIQKINTKTKKK